MDFFLPILMLASLAGVLVLLFGFGQLGVQWVRNRRSAKWPWAPAAIENGDIAVMTSGKYGTTFELTVSYSYQVAGENYSGTYREICGTREAAEGCLKSLRDLP